MRKYCSFDNIGIPLTSNYYHKLKNIGFQKHKNVVRENLPKPVSIHDSRHLR